MKHMSTNELERKLKEKEVELLDEEEYLRSEQGELLTKLEWKQVLNGEKIEQDMLESELNNLVVGSVVFFSQMIKEESRTKEEKGEAEEEQRWEQKKKRS